MDKPGRRERWNSGSLASLKKPNITTASGVFIARGRHPQRRSALSSPSDSCIRTTGPRGLTWEGCATAWRGVQRFGRVCNALERYEMAVVDRERLVFLVCGVPSGDCAGVPFGDRSNGRL